MKDWTGHIDFTEIATETTFGNNMNTTTTASNSGAPAENASYACS
jgi:hypothetical protein